MSQRALAPRSTGTQRTWWAVAALVMLVSLGLPWTSATPGTYLPGYVVPTYCTTNFYDGTTDCTFGYVQPGFYLSGAGAAPGYATSARVFVAAALVLLALVWRLGSRRLLVASIVVAGIGVVLGGSTVRGGQLVLVAAVVCLLISLRAEASGSPPLP